LQQTGQVGKFGNIIRNPYKNIPLALSNFATGKEGCNAEQAAQR
jgi:hypothetical protein